MKRGLRFLALWAGLAAILALPMEISAQVKTVKLALTSKENSDNLPIFVGMKMGFFDEVGLKVEPSYFRGGGEVVRGLTTGSTDLAVTVAASATLIAIARGEPVKIVAGAVSPLVGVVWVVPYDSPIKSIRDLKGKKVGFSSPGSVTHMTLVAALQAEKLEKDVEIVRVGSPGDSWNAVKNGVVASGWHVSPAFYNLVVNKEARVLFSGGDYVKQYQQTVVAAMEETIKKDPDMIRKFLQARAKAIKFIWDNPEKTIALWSEELKLPVDVIRLAYKDLPRTAYESGAPKMENLKGALQEVMDTGAIKTPLDLGKVLDLSLLPR